MKTIRAAGSGFCRSLKVWKGIAISWLFHLILVFLLTLSFKGDMKTGLGMSMITERLVSGLDIEVLGDIAQNVKTLVPSVVSGFLYLLLFGIPLNAFLSGGLYSSLSGSAGRFSSEEFFRASARNFWSFLVISLLISITILILGILIVVIPVSMIMQSHSIPEKLPFRIVVGSFTFFMLIMLIFILVADYARAWNVKNEKPVIFKAMGYGFSRTFSSFLSSYPMILIITSIQVLFGLITMRLIGSWKPESGGGVFILFLVSQLIIFVRLILKIWRYGSVTSLNEMT